MAVEPEPEPDLALAPNEDARLVLACRGGDRKAWERLVRRFERLIYAIPRRARLSEDDASDVFQVVFMRLHENLDRMTQPERAQAWLVTTARRETLRLLRERKQGLADAIERNEEGEPVQPDVADPNPLPDALIEDLQLRHRARLALDALADPCQSLLRLLYADETEPSYAEISKRLGMPPGSIGPTRARCLAKLRALLEAMR